LVCLGGFHDSLRDQFQQRIIQGAHAFLASHLDEVGNLLQFAFADIGAEGVATHENLERRDASAALFLAQGLRDYAFQTFRQAATDLGLFVGGELIDQTVHRHVRAVGVQRAENQMARLGGFESNTNGLDVAHFADQYNIRVFAQGGPQRALEAIGVRMNFALVDETFLVGVHELDRVFDGDDMVGAFFVDEIDERRKRLPCGRGSC